MKNMPISGGEKKAKKKKKQYLLLWASRALLEIQGFFDTVRSKSFHLIYSNIKKKKFNLNESLSSPAALI